jgi:hypothetical protein
MLSTNLPGSFKLCANPAFEEVAVREFEGLVSFAREVLQPFRALGLLLAGSFARGEGVIVADRHRDYRWLSDIECLVVLPDELRRDLPRLTQLLANAAHDANQHGRRGSRGVKVELSPILASRLAAMRPAIFTCELLDHAKLLWGRPAEITMPTRFKVTRDLLCHDAFRLLNNRIMEQVALRLRLENESSLPSRPEVAYALSKFWVEMGTSLSIFLGCYKTSYRARHAALEPVLRASGTGLDAKTIEVLRSKLAQGMSLKLGYINSDEYRTEGSFGCAADIASRIWWWETSDLLGDSGCKCDWSSVPARLRRVQTTAGRIRDWGRLMLRTGAFENLRPAAFRDLLRAGSFGNAVYAAGCLLNFFWDQIGSGDGPGLEINRVLGRLFGVDAPCGPATRRYVAERAVCAWNIHLRSAAA